MKNVLEKMGRTNKSSVKNVKKADSEQAKESKPPTKLQKVEKTKQRDIDAAVIIESLKALNNSDSNLEKGQGFALVTIRTHISKTLGTKMGKARQMLIKETIEAEFRGGRIIMTNDDGEKINFRKRFDLVAGKEKETPRVNN